MRNLMYKQNGTRRVLGFGLAGLLIAVLALVACGSNKHTASVACADTAEMAFTLSSGGHHSTSGGTSGSSSGKTSTTSGGSTSGGTTSGGSTSGGTTSGGSTTSGSSGRYGSNGGTSAGSNGGTSAGSTTSGSSTTGTTGRSVPVPPKGTTRVTVPGEKAYTPPSNKVAQPKGDITAAQKSVKNRRFLMSSGSHYRSPVTKHVYYYHPRSYYIGSVNQDIYNPYDGRNYRSSGYGTLSGHFSPYWNLMWATMLVSHC